MRYEIYDKKMCIYLKSSIVCFAYYIAQSLSSRKVIHFSNGKSHDEIQYKNENNNCIDSLASVDSAFIII